MARHQDGEGIAPHRLPDSARRARRFGLGRDLAIGQAGAGRNGAHHVIDAAMERWHVAEIERNPGQIGGFAD